MTPTNWSTVLTQLAATAALAPSSHNCQPWRLLGLCRSRAEAERHPPPAVDGWSHLLLVCIDRRRTLSALPSLEREMRMSVGGFASLLLNLLRLSDFEVQVRFVETHWQPATARGRMRLDGAEPVLALYLSEPPGGPRPVRHPLLQWIARRHTVRGPYLPQPASASKSACLPYRLGSSEHIAWRHVQPGALFDRLCAFYRCHAAQDFRHGAAWRETYRHLHFTATARPDRNVGINIQSLFGPLPAWRRRLYQGLLHPATMPWVGPLSLYARIGSDFEALLRSSASLVYLCGVSDLTDERRLHLLAGECVIDMWLAATRDGQAVHPLSVVLQHTDIAAQLGALLGCSEPILFIARTGTPAQPDVPALRYRRAPDTFCSFDFTAPLCPSMPC